MLVSPKESFTFLEGGCGSRSDGSRTHDHPPWEDSVLGGAKPDGGLGMRAAGEEFWGGVSPAPPAVLKRLGMGEIAARSHEIERDS